MQDQTGQTHSQVRIGSCSERITNKTPAHAEYLAVLEVNPHDVTIAVSANKNVTVTRATSSGQTSALNFREGGAEESTGSPVRDHGELSSFQGGRAADLDGVNSRGSVNREGCTGVASYATVIKGFKKLSVGLDFVDATFERAVTDQEITSTIQGASRDVLVSDDHANFRGQAVAGGNVSDLTVSSGSRGVRNGESVEVGSCSEVRAVNQLNALGGGQRELSHRDASRKKESDSGSAECVKLILLHVDKYSLN